MTQETHDDEVIMPEDEAASDEQVAASPEDEDVSVGDAEQAVVRERDELRDLLLRKQAEFENFRKRTERERSEFVQFALADCMKGLLNVLDSFELALRDIASEDAEGQAVHRGYELIYKQLVESLERFGLEALDTTGVEFDPHLHEGVSTQPTADAPEGTVLQDLRKGYLLKGKLLRPSMVTVAAPPESDGDEESS